MKLKNNKGFTLEEILVVIAIIGILAVVAVPSLFKHIESAKIAELEQDVRATKIAVESFYISKGRYPTSVYKENEHKKKPITLEKNMNDEYRDTLDIVSEINDLKFPFDASYTIGYRDDSAPIYNDFNLYIKINIPDNKISEKGKEKLKKDLGIKNEEDIKILVISGKYGDLY